MLAAAGQVMMAVRQDSDEVIQPVFPPLSSSKYLIYLFIIYVCMFRCVRVCMCIYLYMFVCICVYCACVYMCSCVYVHVYMCEPECASAGGPCC